MKRIELLQKLVNTRISNHESKVLLGGIIRKEFDVTQSPSRAFELLQVAWQYQVPQFDEMLGDYFNEGFLSI
jgi:hypothetical protein